MCLIRVIIQNKHSWSQIQVQIKITKKTQKKQQKKQKKPKKQLPSRSKNVKIKCKQWICFIRLSHTWTNTYYDLLQNVTWSKQFHICIRWKAFIINLECWGLFHINEFTMVVRPNVQILLSFQLHIWESANKLWETMAFFEVHRNYWLRRANTVPI